MTIKETPNIITAVLKVTATAEFFDDDASEETVRYVIEQGLEDAGFDVDVALLKEQEAVVRCKDCKYWQDNNGGYPHRDCKWNQDETPDTDDFCSAGERRNDDA